MDKSVYLGIDIGTSSTKCLAVGDDGRILALGQKAYGMTHPYEGWAEQNPEDYWDAIAETVQTCVRKLKEQGLSEENIKSLAMSTQGDTLIVTDGDNNPLAPAMSWMDTRPAEECKELLEIKDKEFWYRETGIMLTSFSSACKVRWIAKHKPELMKQIKRFCFVPDYLVSRLCGRFVTDVPSASWSAFYSPAVRDWSKGVMDLLGISRDKLPEAVESGIVIGELSSEAAAELNLSPDTKVVAGAFDQAAAAHGAGATANGRSVLSCGTAWVMYSVTDGPIIDKRGLIPVCCHAKENEWGIVLPFTGGAAYDWLARTIESAPESDKPSESEPPVFIPHLYGGVCPDWREDSKGSLVGLTMSHTREDIRRAIMRGIASEARRNFEAARELGTEIRSIRMVGGAGKSDIWPQMIANILNRPIEVSDMLESACYGVAKLAAGDVSSQWDAAENVSLFEPDAVQVEFENRQYERYLRFYNALLREYEKD